MHELPVAVLKSMDPRLTRAVNESRPSSGEEALNSARCSASSSYYGSTAAIRLLLVRFFVSNKLVQ
jgi:hypothetical protein